MKFFTSSILLLLLLSSCHDLKKQKQLKKTDDLLLSISKMDEDLKEIDSIKIQQISDEIILVRQTIQENYLNDTLTVELGQAFEDYKLAGKQALWVNKNLPIAIKTCLETQERMKNLRLDILAGNGERDQYDAYLKNEEKQVADLKKLHQSILKNRDEAIQNYQELNLKMIEYSKKIILNHSAL